MEVFTTREAAERAGCSVRQWHYLTEKHGITPIAKAGGVRGAMVWTPGHIEIVAAAKKASAA